MSPRQSAKRPEERRAILQRCDATPHGWSDEALFKLLDNRHRRELPTAIASNLCPDELEERVASRLQDVSLSVVIQMSGVDVRPFNERAE